MHTAYRSSLIVGLDCGLDRWAGLLYWITGLTFELRLCVSHDLHPIKCAVNGSCVRYLAANRLLRNKGSGMHATVGVLCLRDLERYAYTTADGAAW